MREAVLIVLCAGLAAVATGADLPTRACSSAERCVKVNLCPTFVRRRPNFTAEDRQRWKNAVCGHVSDYSKGKRISVPKVCCPVLPDDCGISKSPEKIMGGNESIITEFPWMARLGYGRDGAGEASYLCGGSLISERYVLTAAHCVESRPSTVRLGEWDTESEIDCGIRDGVRVCTPPVVDVDVEQILVHPGYEKDARKATGLQNDIALIRLARQVTFTDSVYPICLQDMDDLTNTFAIVAGWGKISNQQYVDTVSRYLMKLQLRVTTHEVCMDKYSKYPNKLAEDKQLCAVGKKGQDACSGDSGGPLMYVKPVGRRVVYVLVGIVSFGPRQCGTNGVPAVFSKVPNYLSWVLENVRF